MRVTTRIGYAFSNLSGDLYPTIGLRTPNESVRVNFGQAPFKFDIDSLLLVSHIGHFVSFSELSCSSLRLRSQDRKRTILSRASETSQLPSQFFLSPSRAPSPPIPTLSTGQQSQSPSTPYRDRLHETLQSLIGGYLRHCGYDDTARAFDRQVRRERHDRAIGIVKSNGGGGGGETTAAPTRGEEEEEDGPQAAGGSSAELRSRILNLAMTDQTKEALELVQEHYPAVLEEGADDDDLVFKLKCRVFVEAVLAYSRFDAATPMPNKGKSKAHAADDQDADMSSSVTSAASTVSIDELLSLGRSLHSAYSSSPSPSVQAELQATLGLMAYRDPEKEAAEGRARRIVRGEEKDRVVERLNRAILSKFQALFIACSRCTH